MKNSVLIISSDYDETVDAVSEWISYYGSSFKRQSSFDIFYENDTYNVSLDNNNFPNASINGENAFRTFYSLWIRKGSELPKIQLDGINDNALKSQINSHLLAELMESKISFIDYLESTIYAIGTIPTHRNNKISQLLSAKKCNLLIPATIITNSKKELLDFHAVYEKIISKNMKDSVFLKTKETVYAMYTEFITKETIEALDDFFIPTIVQEYIDPQYNIKTFYFDSMFYSMAIFDFKNSQIEPDYRKRYLNNNLRYVPISLPKEIEKRLQDLMNDLQLNIGTIDLIKSKNNEFIFLEVNPTGQFGMISYHCNYKLEKLIAKKLCKTVI